MDKSSDGTALFVEAISAYASPLNLRTERVTCSNTVFFSEHQTITRVKKPTNSKHCLTSVPCRWIQFPLFNKNMTLPNFYHNSGHYTQQQEVPFIRSLHFQLLKLDQQNQCCPISTPRAWTNALIHSQHIKIRGLHTSKMWQCVNRQMVPNILKQCSCPDMAGPKYPVIQHHISEEQKHQPHPTKKICI